MTCPHTKLSSLLQTYYAACRLMNFVIHMHRLISFHLPSFLFFFVFNDTATTEIYPLPLHDALPISSSKVVLQPLKHVSAAGHRSPRPRRAAQEASTPGQASPPTARSGSSTRRWRWARARRPRSRSEEHTSELQSRLHLVCRLLLEKK